MGPVTSDSQTVCSNVGLHPGDLGAVLDSVADQVGAWVVLESFGAVMGHGAGPGECPAEVVPALLSKRVAPLRRAVSWQRGRGQQIQGQLGGVWSVRTPVHVTAIEAGVSLWSFGPRPVGEQEARAVRGVLIGGEEPLRDASLAALLRPRATPSGVRPPAGRLLALSSTTGPGNLSRRAAACMEHRGVHTADDGTVFVALAPTQVVGPVFARLRRRVPDVVAGTAVVADRSPDWNAAARLATACLMAARRLGLPIGDPQEPRVKVDVLLRAASEAACEVADLLDEHPLRDLVADDAQRQSALALDLYQWCDSGWSVPDAAAIRRVHPNSVRYRIRKAGELLGLDLDDHKTRVAVALLAEGLLGPARDEPESGAQREVCVG